VDEEGKKEYSGGRTMNCSTKEGGKVKRVSVGIRE
jgi:hypothetical protein